MGERATPVDWDHVYLLGWYDHEGRDYLTSWDGDLPYVNVVVLGVLPETGMPLWNASVPEGAMVEEIPEGVDPHEYAKEKGGYYAFGWLFADGVERRQ